MKANTIPPALLERVKDVLRSMVLAETADQRAAICGTAEAVLADLETGLPPEDILSKRERQVFDLLGCGLENQEIADKLQMTAINASRHLQLIRNRLGLTTSRELLTAAIKRQIAKKGGKP